MAVQRIRYDLEIDQEREPTQLYRHHLKVRAFADVRAVLKGFVGATEVRLYRVTLSTGERELVTQYTKEGTTWQTRPKRS